MSPKTLWTRVSFLIVILSLVLAACAPAATSTVVVEPTQAQVQPTEAQAQPTAVVEPTKPPEPTAKPTDTPFPTAIPTVAEEVPTGELNIALTNDIAGVLPSNAPEWQAGIAAAAFFESFWFYNPETRIYEPALAESCDASDDYKTFTFKLKPDLVFANGEPVNADAVVYSYATLSNPVIAWPYPGEDQVKVTKIDDLTVQMVTAIPTPNWCINAPSDIIPPKYTAEVGLETFLTKPIGTGAFVVDEWVRGSHVTGTANPNFWRKGYPKVEKITFKFITDSATRIASLKTGEVDVITRLNAEEADTLRSDSNITVVEYPVNRVYYVAFNNLTTGVGTPIEDANVRLALNYAVDKQAIIDALYNGKGKVPNGFCTSGDICFDDSFKPIPYDVAKAKELLAAAGVPDGFEIDMACMDSAFSHSNEVCEAVVGYLADVGVKATVEWMESGRFWDMEGAEPSTLPPLFIDSWSSGGDPWGRFEGSMGKNGAYRAYFSQDIQDLLDKIEMSGDQQAIYGYYGEIQKIMLENPPFIYLFQPYTFEATSNRISNYRPRPNEFFTSWDIVVNP